MPLDAPEKFAFTKNNCKFSLLLRISRQQFTIRRQFSTKSINMNPAYITADSSNGLFVNGEKLNRGETRILPFNSKINLSPADRLFTFIDYRADTGLDFPIGLDKHFFIGDILGKGGFGCVRLAFEVETGKKFALKIIRRKLSFSGELERKQHLEQLKNEVDIMRFCSSHPNLVRFYYSAETDTSLFLFMEFVDGCDLSRYVCENSHVPEDDCKFIAYQICKGLEALHAQNIAHRDIKLENIFLSFLPGVLVAKIGDYSFSKYDYNLTTTLGTDFYIPPEVLNSNSEHVYSGAKADIWSLGCLLYALLSQKAPFRSKVDCPPVEDQIQNAYLSFEECIWKKVSDRFVFFPFICLVQNV